jgi:sulfur-oxidizing protein SoxX
MTLNKGIAFAAAFAALTLSSGAAVAGGQKDYTKMSAEELAEYLIFESGSFHLDQPVQEGGKAISRMRQDELQKACTVTGGGRPDADTLAAVSKAARQSIRYPEGGITLGDWKKGAELAWSGYGYRVGHKNDDHRKRETGGNCYNCHQLSADRTGGTIGPDLRGYGKKRGTSEAMIKFAYDMIYNPHATFACSAMPRFGYKKLLSEEQISHVLAFLFDPQSPVNQ